MLAWTEGDVYDIFMREFEISYEHLGQVTTIPLIPGGQDIPVTNENREHYVKAYMDHHLHEHIRQEFAAFQRGFEKICGGEALKVDPPFCGTCGHFCRLDADCRRLTVFFSLTCGNSSCDQKNWSCCSVEMQIWICTTSRRAVSTTTATVPTTR